MLNEHRAAVLGSPVAHSLSPVLHRAAYAWLGLGDWRYDAIEVADAEGLRAVLDGQWDGLSLTMPLKRLVQPMLDVVTDLARDVGAVNTVTFGPGGRVGHNTDVEGITTALAESGVTSLEPGTGCVVGGGATAASALAALSLLGEASPRIVVRDAARAVDALAAAERLGVTPRLLPWHGGAAAVAGARVVVSTVPASAGAALAGLLPAHAGGVLLDVVYEPWPSPAGLAWRRAGGTAVGGFAMLLHQAVAQVRLMTGRDPSVEVMRAAGLATLESPSRGKAQGGLPDGR